MTRDYRVVGHTQISMVNDPPYGEQEVYFNINIDLTNPNEQCGYTDQSTIGYLRYQIKRRAYFTELNNPISHFYRLFSMRNDHLGYL